MTKCNLILKLRRMKYCDILDWHQTAKWEEGREDKRIANQVVERESVIGFREILFKVSELRSEYFKHNVLKGRFNCVNQADKNVSIVHMRVSNHSITQIFFVFTHKRIERKAKHVITHIYGGCASMTREKYSVNIPSSLELFLLFLGAKNTRRKLKKVVPKTIYFPQLGSNYCINFEYSYGTIIYLPS